MSDESIELYKPWTPEKFLFPGYLSEKLDGVPVRIRNIGGTHTFAFSRQNERISSIPHVLAIAKHLLDPGGCIIGELHIRGMPFKDISGLVRKKNPVPGCGKLVLHVFDADCSNAPNRRYLDRMIEFVNRLEEYCGIDGSGFHDLPVVFQRGTHVFTVEEAENAFKLIMHNNPDAEGAVIHGIAKTFQPGKRLWSTQKMKPEPTIDLKIVGFEEAIDKYGTPKGMVGRVVAEMTQLIKGKLVTEKTGIGPGALSHKERTELWDLQIKGCTEWGIAEIKYMKDDTYEGLRQPTFVRWREDKAEPDVRA